MAKDNGGGLTGPLAKFTGVEVAIGAEPVDITVLVVLVAGSIGVTARHQGRSKVVRRRPGTGVDFAGVACAATRWRGKETEVERETGREKQRSWVREVA